MKEKQNYNKRINLGTGRCKKCGGDTCINQRLEPSPKQLRKNYYFSRSEVCANPNCRAIWLREEDKIYVAKNQKNKEIEEKYFNEAPSLFN